MRFITIRRFHSAVGENYSIIFTKDNPLCPEISVEWEHRKNNYKFTVKQYDVYNTLHVSSRKGNR